MNIQDYYSSIDHEEVRDQKLLHITANETMMSKTAGKYMGSGLNNRYFMGGGDERGVVDFNPFTFLGFPGIQSLVSAAEEATKEMLGASVVNLNCLSGIHAMMCAIMSSTEPGDTIMSVGLEHGGHFATKGVIERIGRNHISTSYDISSLKFNIDELARTFKEAGGRAFYMDVSFYINPHNLREIREALGKDAIIIYDASHTMGLIMGGEFQSPFSEGADVICANTHKSLPGPQKGMVTFKDSKFGGRANGIINSGLFSSTHTSSLIALATTILEMQMYGPEYARQIIANSNALGSALVDAGLEVRKANTGRYSENHQVHLITEKLGTSRDLYDRLLKNNMSVNFDHALGGDMFIRLGTQELTRRGMKEEQMKKIASYIKSGLSGDDISAEVEDFVGLFRKAHYSFD